MPFAQFTATGNGSTKQFTIPFPYVKKDHIVVALNNVANTNFTFINDTTIEFNTISSATSTQETSGAPKNGVGIEITRDTPLTNALVDFVDGSTLTAGDLDTAVLQLLYGIQEAKDEAALGIQRTPQGQDAKNQPIINVSDPTNAQDAVTKAFLERVGSITSTQIADGSIVNADVNASAAIAGTKISPNFGSQNIVTSGTVDGRDVSADGTKLDTVETGATADQTNAEIKTAYEANSNTNSFTDALLAKLNSVEVNATTDQTIAEIKSLIAGSPLDASHLAADSVTSSELAANSVTTSKIADAELTTLAGMQSGTASKLADSTALTSDIADLNQLDGMAKQTTITNSDSHFPTSGAVVDFVANQIAPVGGLEVIPDEDSFPSTQPVSGVVISISNADGLVINSSGVATNARTVGSGSDNVTINNFPTSLRNKTLSNELGLLVSSTGTSQIYNYHKLLAKETDVLQLSEDINDFGNRYRVVSTNPTSDNDAGDLIFNTSTSKLLVYNATSGAFEEAQSVGNFFISTFSESFDGSRTDFTVSNAPSNAQQIILSINGVIQKPNAGTSTPSEGFALSGNTVKLSSAPASGSDVFIIVMGSTVNVGTPSNNTVSSSILQNGSVIEAKLGSGAVTKTKLSLISTSSVAGLEVKGDGSSDGYLQLNCSQNSHGIKLKSPPHSAGQSYTLTFPSNIVNGQFLTTDANGNLSWAAVDLTALSASNLTSGTIPDARFPATLPTASAANLTSIPAGNLTGTVADARISTLTASKLTGALPAISGANLTNLPAGGKVQNLVMNGNFKLAQRGTQHNSSGYRTVDRWQMQAGGASATLSQSQYSAISGTSPYAEGHHQAYRIDNAGQNANTQGYVYFVQHIEAQDIVNSNWNFKSSSSYATLSFWIRGSVTQTYLVSIQSGDGTTREWNNLVSLTANQWTKVTITISGDSNITINDDNGIGLSLYFYAYLGGHYTSTGTVNQWVNHAGFTSRPDMGTSWWTTSNSSFMLTGVQLEAGNSASDYAHESFIETLNKCKRYFHVLAHNNYVFLGLGMQYYSASIFIDAGPIDMRTTPTFIAKQGVSGAYTYEKLFGNSAQYIHSIALDGKTTRERCILNMNGDASRQGQAVRISTHYHILSNNEPHVALDAELT
tara:strand:- start:484 stop:3900 length:3417 start_codon:yes stop_codon:yes gene_type:complete